MDQKVRVAIACQGGGSHTAFTAGALKRLLRDQRHEFVALSGTSGGAICPFLAWHALVHGDEGGAGERAAKLLDSCWTDNAASEPFDWLLNEWTVWINRLQGSIVLPSVSPYSTPTSFWAQEQLRRTLKRLVDFGELKTPMESPTPMLLIGAVNVLSGDFKAFNSRRGHYLLRHRPRVDRRNELAGNISLYQEIDFIEKINHLVDKLVPSEDRKEKALRVPGGEGEMGREYKHIEVRWIELTEPLDFASKLDRNPAFIRRMMADGERSAEAFQRRLEPAPATRP